MNRCRPVGSIDSFRPNTITSRRTRPSRRGSSSTSTPSPKEGGGLGETDVVNTFPHRALEMYVKWTYMMTRYSGGGYAWFP